MGWLVRLSAFPFISAVDLWTVDTAACEVYELSSCFKVLCFESIWRFKTWSLTYLNKIFASFSTIIKYQLFLKPAYPKFPIHKNPAYSN